MIRINRYNVWWMLSGALLILCAVLLGVASVVDLRVAETFYLPGNPFSMIGDIVGKAVGFWVMGGAFVLLYTAASARACRDVVFYLRCAIYGAGAIVSFALSSLDLLEYCISSTIVQLAFAGVMGAIESLIVWLIVRNMVDKHEKYRKWAVATILCVVLIAVSTLLLKAIWGRVRFEDVIAGKGEFTPWYRIARQGGDSMPSGHTILSCAIMMFVPLAWVPEVSSKLRASFLVAGFLFIGMIAASRVLAGKHYLSDVMMSALVGGMIVTLTTRFSFGADLSKLEFRKDGFADRWV